MLILILVIWLGFALRLHNLDIVPLRGDEAFSAMFWAEVPLHQSLAEIATIEPHPPLTYVIFHIWNLIIGGIHSPFALRMLDVLANLIGIPVMYSLGKHLTGNRIIGLLSALMWTVHPFEIWHSQDFRNYALWAGLSATTLWVGLRLIRHQRKLDWGLYALFATITAFTFYTELLTLGAFGLFILITQRKNTQFVIRLIGTQTIIVISVLLGFLILQGNLLGSGGYGGNVEPFSAPDYLTRFLPTLFIGDSIPLELADIWIPLFIATLILLYVIYRTHKNIAILTFFLSVLPLALLGIISTRMSIFHPRYVISTLPAFILLFSVGSYGIATWIESRLSLNRNLLTFLIASPWFIISAITLDNYYINTMHQKAPAWDELGEFLNASVSENDLVIQLATDAAFGYYYQGSAPDIGLPASPTQSEADIIKKLESVKTEYNSLYIVANAISSWQNADVVEAWANQNMQPVRLSSASGLGIRQYKTWEVNETISSEVLAKFDEVVELVDYQLFESPLPTGEIALWVYWRPLQRTDTLLKSFVHLVGDINPDTGSPLWVQDDQLPQDGRLDTTTWDTETVYRDVYYLPSGTLQDGDYQILVGWYNPESDTRLISSQDSDAYALTTFTYDSN